jgi:hypothetical protein
MSSLKSKSIPPEAEICEFISIAQLFSVISMKQIKASLTATDQHDKRGMGDLPKKYLVWFIIALNLFPKKSAREVFRTLVETVKIVFGPMTKVVVPVKSSFTEARQRLGKAPLIDLFRRVVCPIAEPGKTMNAFFRGYRLVGIDGTQYPVPDTPANAAAFGRTTTGNTPAAYPAIQVCGLVELGTRVLFDYELGPVVNPEKAVRDKSSSGKSKAPKKTNGEESSHKFGEFGLAIKLIPRLHRDNLLIGDRLYAYYELVKLAKESGAKLLWRIKSDINLPLVELLPDGTYWAKLCDGDYRRAASFEKVRVIEYEIGEGSSKQLYRLITNLAPKEAGALELANLYQERWEIETTIREHKSLCLDRSPATLRSRTPELAEQELVGFFISQFAIRSTMHEAAIMNGEDMDDLSFTHTVNVVLRSASLVGSHPQEEIHQAILDEILEEKVEKQPNRSNPVAVKSIKRKYDVNSKEKRPPGCFGYSKRDAQANTLDLKRRRKSDFNPDTRVTQRPSLRDPSNKSERRAQSKKESAAKRRFSSR